MAFVIVGDAGPAGENWRNVSRYLPPYMCDDCEVGQSIPNCGLCGKECAPTVRNLKPGGEPYPAGTLAARGLQACMVWWPEDEPAPAGEWGETAA